MARLEFSFYLDLVTPLFCGGSDPRRSEPELRVPSLRGQLRWWMRAGLGGFTGGDWELVSKIEGDIFGKAGWASRVTLNLEQQSQPPRSDKFRPDTWGRLRSIPYVAYGMQASRQDPEGTPARPFLPPGRPPGPRSPWLLRISLDDARYARAVVASLWLLSRLGGVGAKVHRGFGGIDLGVQNWPSSLPNSDSLRRLFQRPRQAGEVRGSLENGIGLARAEFQTLAGETRQFTKPPEYSILHPDWTEIYVLPGIAEWSNKLNEMGASLRHVREDSSPTAGHTLPTASGRTFPYQISKDYHLVKRPLLPPSVGAPAGTPGRLVNPIFGLPIQYQFSSLSRIRNRLGSKASVEAAVPKRGEQETAISGRRASPVWLRVLPLEGGGCAGLISVFRCQFLPGKDAKLAVSTDNGVEYYELAGSLIGRDSQVDTFLREFPGKLQVRF